MNFRFVVEVQVARVHGKFAGKDEIETQIQDALDGADPGTYEVTTAASMKPPTGQ